MNLHKLLALISLLALSGCGYRVMEPPYQPIVLRATGQGTATTKPGWSAGQTRLMAMRAAKLDALRNLSERIQGVELHGNSTVQDLSLENDLLKAYLHAYIRGATVIDVRDIGLNVFEATVELKLDQDFEVCLRHRDHGHCRFDPRNRAPAHFGHPPAHAPYYQLGI